MWIILLSLLLGTLLGAGLRQKRRLLAWVDRGTVTAVYLLLFLLGVTVGSNSAAMDSLGILGLQALLLSVGGMVGSITLATILYYWQFHR